MKIETRQRKAYYAPTANKHFFTKIAAIRNEASAMIKKKYPTEREESHNGYITYKGFHWSQDEKLVALYKRLIRILSK